MRWPIRLQLLLPTLFVVVMAIALASAASSYLAGVWARRQQQSNLDRVVNTLADANFLLTDAVLETMSGLSGAEFIVQRADGSIESSTLAVDEEAALELTRETQHGGPRLQRTVSLGGLDYLAARTPRLRPRGDQIGETVLVLFPEDHWWTQTRQLVLPPLVVGAVAVAFVVGITWWLSRRLTRPLGQLCAQTEAIAAGHFDTLVPSRRNDELRDLGLAINGMAARLARYEQEVRQSERLQTLSKLGAGVAHQLRNAITGARMATELHQRDCPGESESLQVALRQLSLMETYVQRFLTHGRVGAVNREQVDLATLAEDALLLVQPAAEHAHVTLSFSKPDEACYAQGDSQALRQMLINLLLNGIEAATRTDGQPGKVEMRIAQRDGRTEMTILDSGPGPAEHVRDRLFEPFVSEKKSGIGLGLAVARQISQEHGGTISWERRDEKTCFTITLPAEMPTHAASIDR
jgi:signal transduction histidine kinase